MAEVHRVRRLFDEGNRDVLWSEPGHLADAGRGGHQGVPATQDGQRGDRRVQQPLQRGEEGQLVEQAKSVNRSEPQVVR